MRRNCAARIRGFIFRSDGELLRQAVAYNVPQEFRDFLETHTDSAWSRNHDRTGSPLSAEWNFTYPTSLLTRNTNFPKH